MIRRSWWPRATGSSRSSAPATTISSRGMLSATLRCGVWIAALCILSLGAWTSASAADWKPSPNPPNCPAGYRCLNLEDYTHMTARMATLEEDLKAEQRKRKHLGFGATLGPSLGVVVDENLDAHIIPSVGVAVGLTLRF